MTLGFRLGRRLVAAAALQDEAFTFQDSRYVRSRRVDAGRGFARYVGHLLAQVQPTNLVYYAPTTPGTLTHELVKALEVEAARVGIAVRPLTKADVFDSFGLTRLRTRQELRQQITILWLSLAQVTAPRQSALAEAAAAAMVGDLGPKGAGP